MIVGWSMGQRIDSRLVVDALEMALAWRLPGEGLVAHSGRGSQYASEHYRRLLSGHGIVCRMSRRANCWDNAPMESFFAGLKKELTRGEIFATRAEARARLFAYIEIFYNRVRRHSSLGYRSPIEEELAVEAVALLLDQGHERAPRESNVIPTRPPALQQNRRTWKKKPI